MVAVATLVLGVLAFSILLGWMLLRAATSVERAKRDPKYRRRLILVNSAICVAGVFLCVAEFAMKQPLPQILCSLSLVLMNVFSLISLARNLKVPPA